MNKIAPDNRSRITNRNGRSRTVRCRWNPPRRG